MSTLLHLCPEVVIERHLAVTSLDSGVRLLTPEEQKAGWQSRGDIAYSPLIQSTEGLQCQSDGLDEPGYDEWYVFDVPRDLGQLFRGNPFEFEFMPGRLMPFVNFQDVALHDSSTDDLWALFWTQLEWIQPESYVADGSECLTLVSRDKALIDRVHERLLEK